MPGFGGRRGRNPVRKSACTRPGAATVGAVDFVSSRNPEASRCGSQGNLAHEDGRTIRTPCRIGCRNSYLAFGWFGRYELA